MKLIFFLEFLLSTIFACFVLLAAVLHKMRVSWLCSRNAPKKSEFVGGKSEVISVRGYIYDVENEMFVNATAAHKKIIFLPACNKLLDQ